MKKIIHTFTLVCLLALTALPITSCSNLGGVTGAITTAQAWLNDPANQAMINTIAQTAITILGGLAEKKSTTTHATVAGKLAAAYPNVPAGAIAEIAKNPNAYVKK